MALAVWSAFIWLQVRNTTGNLGSRNLKYAGESIGSLERSTFSWNVGAGVTLLSHLQVGVTYNIAMGETGKLGGVGDVIKEFDVKNNTWQVRLAYLF